MERLRAKLGAAVKKGKGIEKQKRAAEEEVGLLQVWGAATSSKPFSLTHMPRCVCQLPVYVQIGVHARPGVAPSCHLLLPMNIKCHIQGMPYPWPKDGSRAMS